MTIFNCHFFCIKHETASFQITLNEGLKYIQYMYKELQNLLGQNCNLCFNYPKYEPFYNILKEFQIITSNMISNTCICTANATMTME